MKADDLLPHVSQLSVLVEAIVGLLTVTGLGATIKGWFVFRRRRRQRKAREALVSGFALYPALQALRDSIGGAQAMVLVAHNGGERIKVAQPTYSTVRFQAPKRGFPKVEWDSVPVDEGYWKVLQQIAQAGPTGYAVIMASELTPESSISNLYKARGIERSVVFELYMDDDGAQYWYVSVPIAEGALPSPPEHIAETVRTARHNITHLLKDSE